MMNIIVPIKQVPETSNVKMDPETGTMIRSAVEGIVNPHDLYALETALRLKEVNGGAITAISMGPAKAESALRDALAMGCDHAVLLSDRRFGGSDTWATAYVLSLAIQKLTPFDLVICGERSSDGETGQVGPGLAAFLDLPLATYVSRFVETGEEFMRLERLVEGGREIIKVPLPLVMTVVKEIGNPRLGTVRSKLQSKKAVIPIWGPDDIAAVDEWIGLKGSPTRVVKIISPKLARKGDVLFVRNEVDLEKACNAFVQFLIDRGITDYIPHWNGNIGR